VPAVQALLHFVVMYLKYSLVVMAVVIILGAGVWLWAAAKSWLRRTGPD
jgi:cytoskeletal protein RodZ